MKTDSTASSRILKCKCTLLWATKKSTMDILSSWTIRSSPIWLVHWCLWWLSRQLFLFMSSYGSDSKETSTISRFWKRAIPNLTILFGSWILRSVKGTWRSSMIPISSKSTKTSFLVCRRVTLRLILMLVIQACRRITKQATEFRCHHCSKNSQKETIRCQSRSLLSALCFLATKNARKIKTSSKWLTRKKDQCQSLMLLGTGPKINRKIAAGAKWLRTMMKPWAWVAQPEFALRREIRTFWTTVASMQFQSIYRLTTRSARRVINLTRATMKISCSAKSTTSSTMCSHWTWVTRRATKTWRLGSIVSRKIT